MSLTCNLFIGSLCRSFSGPALFALQPFADVRHFLAGALILFSLIVLTTSLFYFVLHRIFLKLDGEDGEKGELKSLELSRPEDAPEGAEAGGDSRHGPVQAVLVVFCAFWGILGYLVLRGSFHSMKADSFGQWVGIFYPGPGIASAAADTLLAAGIMGMAWGWTRFFQILLVDEIFARYEKLIQAIPSYSASIMTSFAIGVWYFYSNIFPLWWYVISFGSIYGLIYFFSLKDFRKRIKMHLTQSMEYEEELSLKTVSIVAGVVLILGISIPHLIFHSIPVYQVIALYVCLWVVSMYMPPGRIFRQVKLYPRYTSAPARVLNFARYTRKYLLIWCLILTAISFVLGMGGMMDTGFRSPGRSLEKCCQEMSGLGVSLEQYLKEPGNKPPRWKQWKDGKWMQKPDDQELVIMPSCPSGGVYVYRQWRPAKGQQMVEIRCTGGAHRRAAIPDNYPRFNSRKGIMLFPPAAKAPLPDKKPQELKNKK